jgi:hypothetical protein
MPKFPPLTREQLKQARLIHKEVLNENKTLKRELNEELKGKKGSARQKEWGRQIKILMNANALYKAEVRARFKAAGIPTRSA